MRVLSGYASVAVTVEAMRAGADDVKQKPLQPRALPRWIDTGSWDGESESDDTRRSIAPCGSTFAAVSRARLRPYQNRGAPRR